jgi:tetratricopeptide (TPR) repeat protein
MQLGRQALFNNRPDEALARFQRVTESDPTYVNRYYGEGVWTYLGRAQYLTGRLPEARQSLERALSQHSDDYFARLYLGLILARSGDRSAGLKDIESGIKGIYQANENMREHGTLELWDQRKEVRKETENILAMISGKEIDVIAEVRSLTLQFFDRSFQILHFNLDSVPATWSRKLVICHRLSSTTSTGSVDQ